MLSVGADARRTEGSGSATTAKAERGGGRGRAPGPGGATTICAPVTGDGAVLPRLMPCVWEPLY